MAVTGTQEEQTRILARTLLLWRALNFQIAWHKIQTGRSVEWIGARLDMVYDENGSPVSVDITITESKVRNMKDRVKAFLDESWIWRTEVKEFAGLMSWAGSVVPALKPYTQMLWAAAYAHPAGKETRDNVANGRVRFALKWINTMLDKHNANQLCRMFLRNCR